ncbi:MAG: FtsQ-type POTRA domain-containing protein [Chloroflexota bacterium]
MTNRAVRHVGGHARRTRPIRRASAGLSPVRAGAALAMLVSAGAIYGVGASAAFGFRTLELDGDRYTVADDVRGLVGVTGGANLFLVATDVIEARIAQLPTVAGVDVEVSLPATIRVALRDRQPVMTWRVGERSFLADGSGMLFAELGDRSTEEAALLPAIVDLRAESASLEVGDPLDTIDIDAATRLGSVKPEQIGSAARSLRVTVSDQHGFVVHADPDGWTAIFGFYTPSLRTPDLIPGQVNLLRSLLEDRETAVDQVILASDTDGTFVARPTP